MPARRVRAVVSGEVQLVGFRAFVHWEATRLGLRGYVRNLATGEVEVVAEGDEQRLRGLVDLLRQGPRAARVMGVDLSWEEPKGERPGFRIGW